MILEFYLDYLCPKCYLQHKILENMVLQNQLQAEDIIYRSYEMVDHEKFDRSLSFSDFISKYKNMPIEEVLNFLKEQKIEMNLFPIHGVHKMAHLAKKEGKSFAYSTAVFKAMYEDRIDLSDDCELRKLAINVGLGADNVERVLTTDAFSSAVISNKENAQLKGVGDLPFLRINKHTKLRGLSDQYDIMAAMNSERANKSEYCYGENCERVKPSS